MLVLALPARRARWPSAYGIAVTGTMVVTSLLAFTVVPPRLEMAAAGWRSR